MSIKSATPYLLLNGKTEQAIELYQRALGAKVESLQRFGDMDRSCPAEQKNRVMHAVVRAGSALLLMSDGSPGDPQTSSGNVSIALEFDDPAVTRRAFDALAAAGTAIQPLMDAPWGALFGIVQDQFGIPWMFNCPTKSS